MTTTPLQFDLQPARTIQGIVPVPGDKSISHRYVMLGALANGTTHVSHLAPGADVAATVACMRALGVRIEVTGPGAVTIHGRGRAGLKRPGAALDAANSGTTMRLICGILAGCPFDTSIVGDASLSRRPMRRVIEPLAAMGARIDSQDGRAPLVVHGGSLVARTWRSQVASAQVKSAVMLAGLVPPGTTTVIEPMPTRDHSERAFPAFGLRVVALAGSEGGIVVSVDGGQEASAPAQLLKVPGDPSSAAVWAATAAALPGSSVELTGVCLNPHRLGFIRALERMGARIDIDHETDVGGEPVGRIRVSHGSHEAASIAPDEIPSLIDELPVLAARAALGGRLEVSGAGELRVKESDRITALVTGFRAMGVDAVERPDGFIIQGSRRPTGGTADAAADHRLVMAFTLVALGSSGPSTVTDAGAVAVSYPEFALDTGETAPVTIDKVYLVGFMASGKSTTARALGARLQWRHEDVDDLIETREKLTVAEIFARHGETYFRAAEREMLKLLQPMRHLVVATGGGTFADPENRATMAVDGISIWIDVPLSDIVPRIPVDGRRPLAADRGQLEALYAARAGSYALADVRIDAARKPVADIVDAIVDSLQRLPPVIRRPVSSV